jgi:protoporphyrinogen oxidase
VAIEEIVIVGAGMAGLGAAHRLNEQGLNPVIYEKMPYCGGHTTSKAHKEGFIFDEGPHVSFTKDRRIQDLFARSVNGQYETVQYNVNNYWKGSWIKHPAHCNLYGLPPELVVAIVTDFVKVKGSDHPTIRNYEDWLVASYGETFAKTFPMEYTTKYHTTEARNLSTDWLGPRMHQPKLEEILLGALSPSTPSFHYLTEFRYPSRGGFVSFLDSFLKGARVVVGHEVVAIQPSSRMLTFASGETVRYGGLVSSIPLPELIPLIHGIPDNVLEAAERLACSSCVLVNVGIDRDDISQAHVTYFYDHDILYTRLSFPHMMSSNNVPPGGGSIQAEIYYSRKYKPLEIAPKDCVQRVIRDLRRVGLLKENEKILFTNYEVIRYANVIFDLERADALSVVHGYLDGIGIAYCGRYGDWGHIWTDEAFKSGEEAAQKALERTSSQGRTRRAVR